MPPSVASQVCRAVHAALYLMPRTGRQAVASKTDNLS
jgi:hypothetical protein